MKNWFSNKFQEFKQESKQVFKNSLVELIISIIFAIAYFVLDVYYVDFMNNTMKNLFMSFAISFSFIYSLNLFTQETKHRILYYLSFLVIPLILYANIDEITILFGIVISILLICISKKRKEDKHFLSTIIQSSIDIIIAIVLASICFGLLYAIIESIKYIFEIKLEDSNHNTIFFAFSYFIVFPLIFLIFNSNNDKRVLGNTLDNILINNILTPAFYIFGIILYVYFAKILFNFSLPKGVVSATAIGFLVIGLIIKTASDSFEKPLQKWFFDYYSYYSIPALIMLWIATMVRVLEYGLTIPRVYLLLSVIVLTIWVIALLFKNKKKYYLLSIVTIIILSSFTFIPYIDAKSIEKYSQESRPLSVRDKEIIDDRFYSIKHNNYNLDISNYRQIIKMNGGLVNGKWYYESINNNIKIVNDKYEKVYEQKHYQILIEQLSKLNISIEQFKKLKDKEDFINKNADKFFIKDTPKMTIVFSEIGFGSKLEESSFFSIDYILIK